MKTSPSLWFLLLVPQDQVPSDTSEEFLPFAGEDEVIEIKHTAYSRAIFAKGAVAAAKFLAQKKPGLYDMSDVIGEGTAS